MPDSLPPEPQAVCGYTPEDFTNVMLDLLPWGMVWPREPDTDLVRTWSGLAVEYSRLHQRDCDLLAESYPGTCVETISDWERVCGLPDPCTGPLDTLQERRQAVLAKLAARGGQSRQYYIDLAAIYGYTITITEYRPFIAGVSAAGDACWYQSPCIPDQWTQSSRRFRDWWFVWSVDYQPALVVTYFRAGQSCAGDPLATWDNDLLRCIIEQTKPAHTVVLYADPNP
jgi:uncharacterized protein YmfQ (DUF2313 family)